MKHRIENRNSWNPAGKTVALMGYIKVPLLTKKAANGCSMNIFIRIGLS